MHMAHVCISACKLHKRSRSQSKKKMERAKKRKHSSSDLPKVHELPLSEANDIPMVLVCSSAVRIRNQVADCLWRTFPSTIIHMIAVYTQSLYTQWHEVEVSTENDNEVMGMGNFYSSDPKSNSLWATRSGKIFKCNYDETRCSFTEDQNFHVTFEPFGRLMDIYENSIYVLNYLCPSKQKLTLHFLLNFDCKIYDGLPVETNSGGRRAHLSTPDNMGMILYFHVDELYIYVVADYAVVLYENQIPYRRVQWIPPQMINSICSCSSKDTIYFICKTEVWEYQKKTFRLLRCWIPSFQSDIYTAKVFNGCLYLMSYRIMGIYTCSQKLNPVLLQILSLNEMIGSGSGFFYHFENMFFVDKGLVLQYKGKRGQKFLYVK